ncbi:MAG: glycosyltransferase family 4 protein [Candidatus Omnitrophica bacterium]|nr:glycosyltransferase family 4 protein [Candidatus Omnitrophota bacterium]
MRTLFLTVHPAEGPSSRYRVLQYIPHFEANGIHCDVSPFLSREFYRIVYRPGQRLRKVKHLAGSLLRRMRDIARLRRYDLVFIHLGAVPFGPPLFEWILNNLKIPYVFDLDDALFLRENHSRHGMASWFRCPSKYGSILRWSRHVITCNDFLSEYARRYTKQVSMIPTSLDLEMFRPLTERPKNSRPLIGWIGSHTTAPYLNLMKPVLARLAQKHRFTFKVVGAPGPVRIPGVEVVQEDWSLEKDVARFQKLDIGVYPLPRDTWVNGKSGFKTIQYMAVGVPCVVSRVARNCEIVEDGVNGFLADTEEEWLQRLEILLTDAGIRDKFAREGRRTVEERFSMRGHVPRYLEIFQQAARRAQGLRAQEECRKL